MEAETESGIGELTDENGSSRTNRRRILFWGLVLGLGALAAKLGALLSSFLHPPVKANSYGGRLRVGTLADLPPSGGAPEHIAEGRFWLVHDPGGVSALHSSCTHLDCRFTWDGDKELFVCPCHGSEFARDGSLMKGPATRSLDRFPVSLVNDGGEVVRAGGGGEAAPLPVQDLMAVGETDDTDDVNQTGGLTVLYVQVDTGDKIIGLEKSS